MTYWPRSNSFEFDDNGERAIGAKVYFFDAGTSTPRTTYSDAALTTPNAHPVAADGNGRWPAVFLQYGSYKEIATTSGGTELWSTDVIPNPEPTDPGAGVDANAIFQTGDMIFVGKNSTRSGFVRCNGRTLGSAASGGTERANADAATLFAFLWDNYANGQCAVSTGRGATAAADFAANKTITLPDYRAAALTGFDDMGNTAASLYASAPVVTGSGILAGSVLGANTHTLLTAQLPAHSHPLTLASAASNGAHTHTGTTDGEAAHTHTGTTGTESVGHTHQRKRTDTTTLTATAGGGTVIATTTEVLEATDGASAPHTHSFTTAAGSSHTHTFTSASNGAHTHTLSGTTDNSGSDTAHNNMARSAPVTVLMKL